MMDKNLPDTSRRQVLNVFILLSAAYLLMLTIFNVVTLPTDASSWTAFYLARGAISTGLLSVIWWQNHARRTWLAAGAYLLLIAGGTPLFSPFQPLNQVVVVYAFGSFTASFIFAPSISFLFASLALAAYTTIYLISHPTANYDYATMAGLLGLAIAAWLTARITENVREQIRASLESHHAMLERFPIGLYQADKQWRVLDANPAFIRMLGYPAMDSLLSEGNAPTYVDQRVRQEWHTRLDREGVGSTDTQWRRYDGGTLWVHENARTVHNGAGKIVGYEGSVEDITARKRSDEELQRQADIMTILYETTQDVSASQQLPTLLQTLVQRAVKLVGAAYGSIYLFDMEREGWEWRVSIDSAEPEPVALLPTDREIVEQVIQARQPISSSHHSQLPHFSSERGSARIDAVAAAPMLNDQVIVGVLVVNHTDPLRNFTDQDVELLGQFAKHVAIVVNNARQLERTQQNIDDLARLSHAGRNLQGKPDALEILRAACDELQPLAHFTLAFLEESDSSLKQVHMTMSPALWSDYSATFGESQPTFQVPKALLTVWKQGAPNQAICDPDFIQRLAEILPSQSSSLAKWLNKQAYRHTTWLLPVTSTEKVTGILVLVSQHTDSSFTSALSLFAQSVSIAMQASRLTKANDRFATELGMLRRAGSAWRSMTTLDQVASALLAEALAVLGTADGVLALSDSVRRDACMVARGWLSTVKDLALHDAKSIAGHVIASGLPHVSKEFVTDPLYLSPLPASIASGWGGACVPVPSFRGVHGVICVAFQHPRQIAPEEIRLLHTLAEFAGMACVSLQLETRTEQRLAQPELLPDANKFITAATDLPSIANSRLEQITTHLKVDAADVLTLNPKKQVLEFVAGRGFRTRALEHACLRVGEGLAGKAARERRAIRIDDLAKDSSRFARTVLGASEGFVSYLGAPLLVNGQVNGVLEIFNRAPLQLSPEGQKFLDEILTRLANAVADAGFIRSIQQQHTQFVVAYDQTLMAWAQLLELRGHESLGHTQRVTDAALQLASEMKLEADAMVGVRRGALLHDIGKIGIPDAILLSPNPLTKEEWAIIRQHPQIAHDILSPISQLRDALDIPYCHHEHWDGSGYPRGLRGEHIPLAARIFAVVDTWDALTSDRPYRPAWDASRTSAYIRSLAGTAFDPKVVEAFTRRLAQPPSESKLNHILITSS